MSLTSFCETQMASISTKENTLSPSAAAEFKRYILRTKVESTVNKIRMKAIQCAGLIIAPCLLYGFVTVMGQYHNSNPQVRRSLSLPEVISQSDPVCRTNAVAYVVRKENSGSIGSLARSLDLLYENYLNEFYQDSHVFLFHTGDFDAEDLKQLEWRFSESTKGTIHLVNIANTPYWQLPEDLVHDDKRHWHGAQDLQRLHEHRFWSIKVWDYFDEINRVQGCNYRHVMRMHQESFIYSPIKYNIFEFMQMNDYQYGYRLCSYEMASAEFLWDDYQRDMREHKPLNHDLVKNEACAFYNPFFVADLQLFLSPKVQRFLRFVDKGGYIYRNDITASVVHTMAVASSATSARDNTHRFLDFTFEHFDRQTKAACPTWGSLQVGYNDLKGKEHLNEWVHIYLTKRHCKVGDHEAIQIHTMEWSDLSPTYSHLPREIIGSITLPTVTAGLVDLPHRQRVDSASVVV